MDRPKGGALVVHCSSAEFQQHFQDFLRGRLGLNRYALVALPGGVQALTLERLLPKFSWAGWRFIKFLMDQDAPTRVILIAHERCRWYSLGPQALRGAERDRQERDLRLVRSAWSERFPATSVEAYYARIERAGAVFDALG